MYGVVRGGALWGPLTAVVDGVGDDRLQGQRVLALAVLQIGRELEPHHVEIHEDAQLLSFFDNGLLLRLCVDTHRTSEPGWASGGVACRGHGQRWSSTHTSEVAPASCLLHPLLLQPPGQHVHHPSPGDVKDAQVVEPGQDVEDERIMEGKGEKRDAEGDKD